MRLDDRLLIRTEHLRMVGYQSYVMTCKCCNHNEVKAEHRSTLPGKFDLVTDPKVSKRYSLLELNEEEKKLMSVGRDLKVDLKGMKYEVEVL